ncbi:MAG: lytic transglycosylase domain-containing protein, partial [Parcubacteria group bacterium]
PRPEDPMSEWTRSPCGGSSRYRYLHSGEIEVEGVGIPRLESWPAKVDEWKLLISQSAEANGVSPALLAAIVAIESGGESTKIGEGGRLGLTQLSLEMARLVSGSSGVGKETVLHPSWNLIYGARLILQCIDAENLNIVGALARFNSGKATCSVNAQCDGPDRWGVWTLPCSYVDSVIAAYNSAIMNGYAGAAYIDLDGTGGDRFETGEDRGGSGLVVGLLAIGAIAAGVYGFTRIGQKR